MAANASKECKLEGYSPSTMPSFNWSGDRLCHALVLRTNRVKVFHSRTLRAFYISSNGSIEVFFSLEIALHIIHMYRACT